MTLNAIASARQNQNPSVWEAARRIGQAKAARLTFERFDIRLVQARTAASTQRLERRSDRKKRPNTNRMFRFRAGAGLKQGTRKGSRR